MATRLRSGWRWVSRATVTSGSVRCHAGIEWSLFYPVSLRWIGCHSWSVTVPTGLGKDFVIKAAIAGPVYVSFAANTKSMLFFHRCLKPPLVRKLAVELSQLPTDGGAGCSQSTQSRQKKSSCLSCEEAWSFGAIKTINSRMQAKFSGDRLGRSTSINTASFTAQLHGLLARKRRFFNFWVKLSENVSVTNRSTLDDVSPGTMNNPEERKELSLRIRKSFGVRIFSRALSLAYYPLGYHISCTRQVWYGTEPHRLSLTLEETTITRSNWVDLRQTRSITTQSELSAGVQWRLPKITFRNCAFNWPCA